MTNDSADDDDSVIRTTVASISKHVNTEQRQQIIRTSVVWSGCSTFSYVHPMRALVNLGSLKVATLIDTGSDYDAIDRDLSSVQEEKDNSAFKQHLCSSESVCGFSNSLKMRSDYVSQWELTLTGAQVFGGDARSVTIACWFTEFSGLGDPLIIGMPTIDKYGGMESVRRYCWVAGVWIPRFFAPKLSSESGTVKSISSVDITASLTSEDYSFQQTKSVDDSGLHLHQTFWNPEAIRTAFGDGYHSGGTDDDIGTGNRIGRIGCRSAEMWLEASSCCHPDLVVLNTVVNISDLDDDSNALVVMSVLIKARSDCNVMVGPSDVVCSLRAVNSDCEQALTDFHIARMTRESISVPETGPDVSSARIATSRYRTATRAEDQVRLFLDDRSR